MRQMGDIAWNNSQRLNNLVNDLLDMEKIAADKMQFNMQPLDIMRVLANLLSNAARLPALTFTCPAGVRCPVSPDRCKSENIRKRVFVDSGDPLHGRDGSG